LQLRGNIPAEATTHSPVAHADPSMQLNMQVTLGLRNRAQLDQLLQDQENPASPRYYQWLTPAQFTARFGPSQQNLDAVVQWLRARGLKVTSASLAQRYVRFTGAVADAQQAFGTNIMVFGNGNAYSNITEPAIPAQFTGVITAVSGLDNFLHSMAFSHHPQADAAATSAGSGWSYGPLALLDWGPALPKKDRSSISTVPDTSIGGVTAFAPSDFYTFYNQKSPTSGGPTGGGGDCLAIVGDSDYTHGAVDLFNTQFGLPASSISTVLVDGSNPGVNGDELEALLDLEWSHAVAPGAVTRFYLGDSNAGTPNGPIIDAIQSAVHENLCGTISVSFGLCGGSVSFFTTVVSPIYLQAASQGQSIFISAGDDGAASIILDTSTIPPRCVPGTSRNVNEMASDPNVTQVGGTKFDPIFDGAGNDVGHVAEAAWDDESSDPPRGGATGGGVSAIYSKPEYQKGPGVPAGGNRDVPDIALIASNFHPGVFLGFNNGGPAIGCCIGGTSLSAPAWAGISKLIAQLKKGRPGPINPRIYAMANAGLAASGFRDVTTGNNNFNGVVGFSAGPGFDLTTGWGTVDINTFTSAFVGPLPAPVITSIPAKLLVGSSFTITGSNFSPGAVVNFFVATSSGPVNKGPLTPSSHSSSLLTVPIPATVPLGQGFVDVQVVNADSGFKTSNLRGALLQGSAAAGIPSLTSINGVGLAVTSANPNFATNNVQTVIIQGTSVTLGGTGFDSVHGVAVNVFCACTGGKVAPIVVSPGGGLTSNSFRFALPPGVPSGPASIVVINKGADGSYSKSSNAVSVPVGATIRVTSVTQSGSTITVHGTGFSTLTVINFFNNRAGHSVNLGGLAGGVAKIHLTVSSSTKFTFTKPAGAQPGASYVQGLNPPFVPYTTSGGSGGAFTLL
jgi:subtilase family serine protease